MTGDPFLDGLASTVLGEWPWLICIGALLVGMILNRYNRRYVDKVWDRAFVRTVMEAREAGITVTEHDTIATMEQKIANHRAARSRGCQRV